MSLKKCCTECRTEIAEIVQNSRTKDTKIKRLAATIKKQNQTIQKLKSNVKKLANWKNTHGGNAPAINKLKSKIKRQESIIKKRDSVVSSQAKTINDLNSKLAYYDNPHTPPSCNTLSKAARRKKAEQKRKDEQATPKRRGAPKGHKGVTNKPKPSRTIKHKSKSCPGCKHTKLVTKSVERRLITEVEKVPKPTTTLHEIYEEVCSGCGMVIKKDVAIPSRGEYGCNIVKMIISNHIERMPVRRNAKVLNAQNIKISYSSVHNCIAGISKNLDEPVEGLIETIRKALILHIDETSYRLKGKNVWVWIFYDPATETAVYVIRPSRGANVLKEVLGADWDHTIVCDGWRSYGKYVVQRCWAHLMREMKDYAEKCDTEEGYACLKTLQKIYADASDTINKSLSLKKRQKLHKRFTLRLKRLINKHRHDPVLGKFMMKLKRALPDMFRFVLDPNIPPTNNAAERGLREIVVHRKIRGSLRAEESMKLMGDLFSFVMTCKSRGLDYLTEIARYV